MIKNFKVGQNKGRSRVWLDGLYLNDYGFKRGVKYTTTIKDDAIVLLVDQDGSRKVAGKGDKPIIDLCNNNITNLFSDFERVYVSFDQNSIIIEGAI